MFAFAAQVQKFICWMQILYVAITILYIPELGRGG
jgi:hypothetical protein